jgi:hypothetical protein
MSFTDYSRRISALAVYAMSEAQDYLFNNPRHIGLGEIELKAAEADLESALRMIRHLRQSVDQNRAQIQREAAE